MILVDTNFLLYAVYRNAPEHRACNGLLREWSRGATPWYTTWSVVYEFLRVVSHPRVLEKPWRIEEALAFVRTLLTSGGLRVLQHTEEHLEVLSDCLASHPDLRGSALHDLHVAVVMREHGIRRIVTRDRHFHAFDFVEVVDPLKLARTKG
jgi:toxin-antitoxin system PIN domain toxin